MCVEERRSGLSCTFLYVFLVGVRIARLPRHDEKHMPHQKTRSSDSR